MKVLVMGGTEFVSAALAKHFITCGHVVDICTRGQKPVEYEGIHEHLVADRHDVNSLKAVLNDKVYECVVDVSAYTKKDMTLLLSVLDRSHIKKFIFCSSGGVYEPSNQPFYEASTRGENHNWGAYGLNKKEAEDYLMSLYKSEQFPITIFRPSYIYGGGNNLYRQSYFIDRLNDGLNIPYPAGTDTVVQFIHIEDLVKTFESVLTLDVTNGESYNLTHTEKISWISLIETVMFHQDKKVELVPVSRETMSKHDIQNTRQFFPYRDVKYLMCTDKLKKHQLHVPVIDLNTGIQQFIEWYKTCNKIYMDGAMTKIGELLERT